MNLVKGKKGLIMGVANERSIAWGISQKLAEQGAELAFTYLGDALKKRVIPLAQSLKSDFTLSCNVENKEEIVKLFEDIKAKWGKIDFVVHAVAFSDKSELSGEYLNTSRENFLRSMLISCFSFTEVAKEASKIMNEGGSMLTLTYESTKAIPNYNVMGVCKSALEASVKYLARDLGAKGIRVNAAPSADPRCPPAAGGPAGPQQAGEAVEGEAGGGPRDGCAQRRTAGPCFHADVRPQQILEVQPRSVPRVVGAGSL